MYAIMYGAKVWLTVKLGINPFAWVSTKGERSCSWFKPLVNALALNLKLWLTDASELVFWRDLVPALTTAFIALLHHRCTERSCKVPWHTHTEREREGEREVKLKLKRSDTSRGRDAELSIGYIWSQTPLSLWKAVCLCVYICVGWCLCMCIFCVCVRASHICGLACAIANSLERLLFFFSSFLFSNKYAQHISSLYLGKIDGIAAEQNIYHFCLWLIVVLGRERDRRRQRKREGMIEKREERTPALKSEAVSEPRWLLLCWNSLLENVYR